MAKNQNTSFKIRWRTSKEKNDVFKAIAVKKGNESINEWIKKLIEKELSVKKEKDFLRSLSNKLDQILTVSKNVQEFSAISEKEIRMLFWLWASKEKIDLKKAFAGLELDGKHGIPEIIK